MPKLPLTLVLSAALFLAGCTSYHRVTDNATGKVYYTAQLKKKEGGAVVIKDAATGDNVTIQNAQVSKITKEEFETNRPRTPQGGM